MRPQKENPTSDKTQRRPSTAPNTNSYSPVSSSSSSSTAHPKSRGFFHPRFLFFLIFQLLSIIICAIRLSNAPVPFPPSPQHNTHTCVSLLHVHTTALRHDICFR